jgi:hypothetical protein
MLEAFLRRESNWYFMEQIYQNWHFLCLVVVVVLVGFIMMIEAFHQAGIPKQSD